MLGKNQNDVPSLHNHQRSAHFLFIVKRIPHSMFLPNLFFLKSFAPSPTHLKKQIGCLVDLTLAPKQTHVVVLVNSAS